jgi:hypothetical protein
MQKILNDVEIFDNILSKNEIEYIHGELISCSFPWYMISIQHINNELKFATSRITETNQDENVFEAWQMCHAFIDDNKILTDKSYITEFLFQKIRSVIDLSDYNFISRIKANYQSKFITTDNSYNTPHTDSQKDHLVIIYYANDSDGDTFIFENSIAPWKVKQRISPKAGRFLVFNGNQYHSGIHPKSNDYRIVINFNLMKV